LTYPPLKLAFTLQPRAGGSTATSLAAAAAHSVVSERCEYVTGRRSPEQVVIGQIPRHHARLR
jgi:hypothetical protein